MNKTPYEYTISDLFDWLLIALSAGVGFFVLIKLAWFVYKIFAGTYHLLDKLIDHL